MDFISELRFIGPGKPPYNRVPPFQKETEAGSFLSMKRIKCLKLWTR